jgi:hypothetical protein
MTDSSPRPAMINIVCGVRREGPVPNPTKKGGPVAAQVKEF